MVGGGDDGRLLSLSVSELVDIDSRCTNGEPAGDATCGGDQAGELSASLVQQVGLGPCPAGPPVVRPVLQRGLPALRERPLVLQERLRRGEVVCVRLRLLYENTDFAAGIVSQSDRTTWRYVFGLTASGG